MNEVNRPDQADEEPCRREMGDCKTSLRAGGFEHMRKLPTCRRLCVTVLGAAALLRHLAAINRNDRPGDDTGVVGRQEQHHVGDVLHRAAPF